MSYRPDKLVIATHTHTHRPTDAGDDNTRRPKLASGKNSLQWFNNEQDGISNHQCLDYLLNRLFRHISKKTLKLCVLAFVREIHHWLVDSPHKGPVTWKMFPFDYVIMPYSELLNLGAHKFSILYKTMHFNVWLRYFVGNFKGTLSNSTQHILPIYW